MYICWHLKMTSIGLRVKFEEAQASSAYWINEIVYLTANQSVWDWIAVFD